MTEADHEKETQEKRNNLIQEFSKTLYEYATTHSSCTWNGKRSGLIKPKLKESTWKSCGGFRAWKLFAVKPPLLFCCDGFEVRSGKFYGSISIAVNGGIILPADDSRSQHSLRPTTTDGGKLIDVTNELSVSWEPIIEDMNAEFLQAYESLVKAVKEYDDNVKMEFENKRKQEIEEARKIVNRSFNLK